VPIFEYECRDCGARFEHLTFNRESEVRCRACNSAQVMQLLSTFAVAGTSNSPAPKETGPCGSCNAAQRGMCGVE
jgi:putative FmdB family regulatory protein